MKTINLAYVCSEEYAPYFSTTLISLLTKLDKNCKLNIYVLTEDFKDLSKKKINTLKKYHDFNVEYIYLKDKDYSFLNQNIQCPVHVSRIAASRILLPVLLPDVDKILTLEVDQLINDDISKLYDLELENYTMGAVEDFASFHHSQRLWGKVSDYYNCGVCLINLKKLRENNYLDKFKKRISDNSFKYKLQEQDIWNDCLRNQIKRIDIRWNLYHCFYPEWLIKDKKFKPKNEEEYQKACSNPGIYHFVSEDKCWFPTVNKPYSYIYRKYEKMNPYYKSIKLYNYVIENKRYFVITINQKIIFKFVGEKNSNIFKWLFSVCNSDNKKHKILTILGLKIKFKKKKNKLEVLRNIIREEVSGIVAREVSTALSVARLHSQTFPRFKNINAGKAVAIVGCGPTVKYYNFELDTVNIALNKSVLLDNFNFKYLFSWDYNGFKEYGELNFFERVKVMDCVKFFGRFLNESSPEIPVLADDEKNKIYHFYSAARYGLPARSNANKIHTDIETHPLADFMSVSFAALQFALYTQPDKIYLIGLDTTNSGHILNCNHEYYVNDLLNGYKRFQTFIENFYPQIEIISVNPVGLKGMFRDVYTQSYINDHPELLEENVEILQDSVLEKEESACV